MHNVPDDPRRLQTRRPRDHQVRHGEARLGGVVVHILRIEILRSLLSRSNTFQASANSSVCAHPPRHEPEELEEVSRPVQSASTSLTMSWSPTSVGLQPSKRFGAPRSLVVTVPSPSSPEREEATTSSAICPSIAWSATAPRARDQRGATLGEGEGDKGRVGGRQPQGGPCERAGS